MLPDVGMVKVYPKCVLKAANVDWVVTLTRNTLPCSWTFSTSQFFHVAPNGIRDTAHHPHISTCFCGKHFYSPCSYTFYGVQTAWQVTASHVYTYRLALKVYSHKHAAKYVINYACPRVHYSTHQSGVLPFQQEGNLTVHKSLIIIDTSASQ